MSVTSPTVRVIGIGSPAGDDQLGWVALDALQARLAKFNGVAGCIRCQRLDRPGPELLRHLVGCDVVLLIDAVQCDEPPGTIRCFSPSGFTGTSVLSSHAMGLAYTLKLGRTLGALPSQLWIYTMELDHHDPGLPLSEPVDAAIPELVERLMQHIDTVLTEAGGMHDRCVLT